jgi:hypothetical protein
MPTIHDQASRLVLRPGEIVIELDSSPLLHFSSHFRLNEAEFLNLTTGSVENLFSCGRGERSYDDDGSFGEFRAGDRGDAA